MAVGNLALVGSGEYTLEMLSLESELIESGRRNKKEKVFVQFATAAGLESKESIEYWRTLGEEQARRIGVKQKFIEVFNREDATDSKCIQELEGASLIYFSGGNPKHLAETLKGTLLWDKILSEFKSGSSLAGCSAGAMMMGSDIAFPVIRKNHISTGLALISKLAVLPHYDRYFGKIPNLVQNLMFNRNHEIRVIGIDENTALVRENGFWKCQGLGKVHVISEKPSKIFGNNESLTEIGLDI